jgi:NADPH-dependent glutamate synthase beta subunit-like oxidoreductase
MKERYVLPAVLGRVCPAFCEKECRRNLVEEPIAIRQLKRFAADYDLAHGPWMPDIPESTGKKVAVVGGGLRPVAHGRPGSVSGSGREAGLYRNDHGLPGGNAGRPCDIVLTHRRHCFSKALF